MYVALTYFSSQVVRTSSSREGVFLRRRRDGPYRTEAGDANCADATGTAAERVTDERLHIAVTTHPRAPLDEAPPNPLVRLEDLPTEVIGSAIMPMLGLRDAHALGAAASALRSGMDGAPVDLRFGVRTDWKSIRYTRLPRRSS